MKADGTTITPDNKVPTDGKKWSDALKEYTGYDFSTKQEDIKLKSKKWKLEKDTVGTKGDSAIGALVSIKSDGSVTVEYDPASVKDGTSGTTATTGTP